MLLGPLAARGKIVVKRRRGDASRCKQTRSAYPDVPTGTFGTCNHASAPEMSPNIYLNQIKQSQSRQHQPMGSHVSYLIFSSAAIKLGQGCF